ALFSFSNILIKALQIRVFMCSDEQIERIQYSLASLGEGQELLVKDDKLAPLHFSPANLQLPANKQPPAFHPINKITLLHEALAHLRFRIPLLNLLCQATAFVSQLD